MLNEKETNKIEKLKSEIFDIMRQIEYLVNTKTQKLQELNLLEEKTRQEYCTLTAANSKQIENSNQK
jgi:hypothetical protein